MRKSECIISGLSFLIVSNSLSLNNFLFSIRVLEFPENTNILATLFVWSNTYTFL